MPYLLATETGIHAADLASGKALLDRHVKDGLDQLILALRDGTLTPTDPVLASRYEPGREAAFVAEQIRDAWQTRFVAIPDPGSDVLIGILRTLLNSIKTFSTASPDSRGYLGFLAGFLKNAGVRMDDEDDGPLDPLEDAGEAWVFDGDEHSRADFYRLAQAQITGGHRERVIEVVQSLISGADGLVQRELIAFAVEIQKG